MSRLKFILPAVVLMGGLIVPATVSFGKPEFTRKEKKACSFCHSTKTPSVKDLNKVGECYKKAQSLQGCEAQ
jgi:hypothetical protein